MTSSPEPGSDAGHGLVLRAAIRWRIRLDENPDDPALRAALEEWIGENPENAAAWAHADHVLGLIGQAKSVSLLPMQRAEQEPRLRPVGASAAKRWVAVAAAVALLAVLSPQIALRWQADYVTGTSEQRTLTLEDGSTVRLAPGSAIGVGYVADRRSVRLLSGEAYFEVKRDPARPFEVAVRAAKVTVLGTGFNMRLGDEGADVAVRHGRVRMNYPDGSPPFSEVLQAGQWARLAWKGKAVGGVTSPALVGGWTGERLIAVDRPLSDVVADVRRYYRGAIILSDRELGRRIVTGSYDMRDPAQAVATIVHPLGASVTRITPWLVIVSAP